MVKIRLLVCIVLRRYKRYGIVGVVTVVVGKLCSSQNLQFCVELELGLVGLTCNLVSQTYSNFLKSCNCAAVRLESLMRSSRAVQVCGCRAEAMHATSF